MVDQDILAQLRKAREKKAPKEKKPLNKGKGLKPGQRSEKMKGVMAALAPLYDRFLSTRPDCELRTEVCTGQALYVHHVKGRGIKVILDDKYWKACCSACNDRVEAKDAEARENGNKISKHQKS